MTLQTPGIKFLFYLFQLELYGCECASFSFCELDVILIVYLQQKIYQMP